MNTSLSPKISVVIATHNRISLLEKCLDSLLSPKSLNNRDIEIIVVDDGSEDGTESLFKKKYAPYPFISYFRQEKNGPAKARNVGIWKAKGDVVAFVDDDCVPDPGWLSAVGDFFSQLKDDAILGVEGETYSDPERMGPFTKQMVHPGEPHVYPTCNIAYRRKALLEVGGFDENYPYPVNEDVDLGWRVLEKGKIGFCPKMRVFHPPLPVSGKEIIFNARFCRSEFYLYLKNPALYIKLRVLPKITDRTLNKFLRKTFLRFDMGLASLILLNLFFRDTIGRLAGQRKWIAKDPAMYLRFAVSVLSQKCFLFYLLISNQLIPKK